MSKALKFMVLFAILLIYASLGIGFKYAADNSMIKKSTPLVVQEQSGDFIKVKEKDFRANLLSAENYFRQNLAMPIGHVNLYLHYNQSQIIPDENTNSEAVSYYMLWLAMDKDKPGFDLELGYVQKYMTQPDFGYLMWRLNHNDSVEGDGANIASDADLRMIKALLIAEKEWGDKKYTMQIENLANGLKRVAITNDTYLAPYGGASGTSSSWTADEVWLSYSDFTVFNELSDRFGAPWKEVYGKMKQAVLKAQLYNGLYNSMLTNTRAYGNSIDGSGYSINSMWIMVRNAESNDPLLKESAQKSLDFYKKKFAQDGELFSEYSSSGDALSPSDTPWVYALVGRAAVSLGDKEFSKSMLNKLTDHQVADEKSPLYGSFPEGSGDDTKVGQFTMSEGIITLKAYLKSNGLMT